MKNRFDKCDRDAFHVSRGHPRNPTERHPKGPNLLKILFEDVICHTSAYVCIYLKFSIFIYFFVIIIRRHKKKNIT